MKVWVEVEKVAGKCSAGLKEGDKFALVNGVNIEIVNNSPICIYALSGLIPYLTSFSRKTDSKDWINKLKELACPDPVNQVIFNLLRESENE